MKSFFSRLAIALTASTATAAATVVTVNHTEFGQKYTPEVVKTACRKTEDVVVAGATRILPKRKLTAKEFLAAQEKFRKDKAEKELHEQDLKAAKAAKAAQPAKKGFWARVRENAERMEFGNQDVEIKVEMPQIQFVKVAVPAAPKA